VQRGQRLAMPAVDCPAPVSALATRCWDMEPSARSAMALMAESLRARCPLRRCSSAVSAPSSSATVLSISATATSPAVGLGFAPGSSVSVANVSQASTTEVYAAAVSMSAAEMDLIANVRRAEELLYGLRGMPKDFKAAFRLFQEAANGDHLTAAVAVAHMTREGLGTKKDEAKADAMLEQLAPRLLHRNASGGAWELLGRGVIFALGIGVDAPNLIEAERCFRAAADGHLLEAVFRMGAMHQLANKHEDAFAWYSRAAVAAHVLAQCRVGDAYYFGRGVAADYHAALEWFRKAADQGSADARCFLGWMYENGHGVARDEQKAVEFYCKAALQDHARAQCNLGVMYDEGRGVAKNLEAAAQWYHKAAERGNAKAQRQVIAVARRLAALQAIKQQRCTFTVTGEAVTVQQYWRCRTCNLVDNQGICASCFDACHAGALGGLRHALTPLDIGRLRYRA
jgi:TPR repeat protein